MLNFVIEPIIIYAYVRVVVAKAWWVISPGHDNIVCANKRIEG